MSDIIDRIDELVDEQLADGEPENGYDFSRYAHDDQEPIWAPRADTRQRATARPAHTHVCHRTRGRTRR